MALPESGGVVPRPFLLQALVDCVAHLMIHGQLQHGHQLRGILHLRELLELRLLLGRAEPTEVAALEARLEAAGQGGTLGLMRHAVEASLGPGPHQPPALRFRQELRLRHLRWRMRSRLAGRLGEPVVVARAWIDFFRVYPSIRRQLSRGRFLTAGFWQRRGRELTSAWRPTDRWPSGRG